MGEGDGGPRPGLPGAWDRLVGPGATAPENLGTAATAVLGALIGHAAAPSEPGWGPLRRGAAVLMGADLVGGIWVNATPAATRWYHGRGQGVREMLAFSAAHLHPFLVAALYRNRDWRFAWGNYAYLLAATLAVAGAPPRQRRAIGLALSVVGAWLDASVWRPTPGMGWFAPAYFLKLLASHAAGSAPEEN